MTRYFIRVEELAKAHGKEPQFAWTGQSPDDLARALERSLQDSGFIAGWRNAQPEPDDVDPTLLAVDPGATVTIEDKAHQAGIIVTTRLPHRILSHRLNLLIGSSWTLGDVQ